jgi:acetyl/propionyl-CoA carboxylase alpha subunit
VLLNSSIKAQSGGFLQSSHIVGSRVFYVSLIQTEKMVALHTSREGKVEAPCRGFVRKESLADGTEVIAGDMVLTQENALLLEPAVAVLTEHMRNQTSAAYSGNLLSTLARRRCSR